MLKLENSELAKNFALYDPDHIYHKQGLSKLRLIEHVVNLIIEEPDIYTCDTITLLAQNRNQWRNWNFLRFSLRLE
jgi:hypothetical protein